MSKARQISIRHVAKAAGVSPTTVSRVLSGNPIPTDSTRQRVMAVVKDLNYCRTRNLSPHPSPVAKRSIHRGAAVVAIVSTPAYPGSMDQGGYHGQFMQGLHKVLDQRGCKLVWGGSLPDDGEWPEAMTPDRIDGVIVEGELNSTLSGELCRNFPVVFSGSFLPLKVSADAVGLDIEHSMVESIDYLTDKGHQHIALMVQTGAEFFYRQYVHYLHDRLAEDIRYLSAPLALSDSNYESVIDDYIDRLKQCHTPPTAILCAYRYAPVLVGRLQHAGLTVPQDISIISLAEREFQLVTPALTCYAWCRESIGVVAAELLMSRLESPDRPYRRMLIRGGLTQRDSCISRVRQP